MLPSAKHIAHATKANKRIFGLTIGNIPTFNLRCQYARDREIVFADGLAGALHAWKFQLTDPLTVIYPDPDVYFTLLIRTTVVGLECTLQGAAKEELAFSNRLTKELSETLRSPTKLSRSIPDAYYNQLPACVDPKASLQIHDNKLWADVNRFYKEIRNPLFHGNQLHGITEASLRSVFGMFDQVFRWIDTWSDPLRLHKILASGALHVLK